MKTAMQKLIEILKDQHRVGAGWVEEEAKKLLEVEKQQIIDAYWGGLNGAINDYSEAKTVLAEMIGIKTGGGAERYYFETYEGE